VPIHCDEECMCTNYSRLGLSDYLRGKVIERLEEEARKIKES
jgi:hypothetical protein